MNTVWLNVGAYIKTWSHILQKKIITLSYMGELNTLKIQQIFDLLKFHC